MGEVDHWPSPLLILQPPPAKVAGPPGSIINVAPVRPIVLIEFVALPVAASHSAATGSSTADATFLPGYPTPPALSVAGRLTQRVDLIDDLIGRHAEYKDDNGEYGDSNECFPKHGKIPPV